MSCPRVWPPCVLACRDAVCPAARLLTGRADGSQGGSRGRLTCTCSLCPPQRVLEGKGESKSTGRLPEAPGEAAAGRGS